MPHNTDFAAQMSNDQIYTQSLHMLYQVCKIHYPTPRKKKKIVVVLNGDCGMHMWANLEVAGGVDEQVGGLEIPVQHVGGVNVLEASQDLVEEVADVVVA